jgi:transposase
MVDCVVVERWTIEATADRFQVDPKTVRKWRDRFLAEGEPGLQDRSSRPKRSPNRTPLRVRRQVTQLRKMRRWGADRIAHRVGLAPSTVQHILRQAGLGRLDRGDRATAPPVRRYQRDRPGELIHVDVKKLASIPDGGGWRTRGRGYDGEHAVARRGGYRFLHTALDDRTSGERASGRALVCAATASCAAASHADARCTDARSADAFCVAFYAAAGITCERVLTDNGSCYKSGLWHRACAETGTTVKKTRPRRPQTNGKVCEDLGGCIGAGLTLVKV